MAENQDFAGMFTSPGGFIFGVQGWTWGDQKPSTITFFLNGTCKVSDQHGRPIKGTVSAEGKPLYFDQCTHAQVIAALAEERIEWTTLTWAGWPQLPYDVLKKLPTLPLWPFASIHQPTSAVGAACTCVQCSIKDVGLRKDALRLRREVEELRAKEMVAVEE